DDTSGLAGCISSRSRLAVAVLAAFRNRPICPSSDPGHPSRENAPIAVVPRGKMDLSPSRCITTAMLQLAVHATLGHHVGTGRAVDRRRAETRIRNVRT